MLTAGSSWQNLESPLYGKAVPFGLQLEWLITAGSYQVVTLEAEDLWDPRREFLTIIVKEMKDTMLDEEINFVASD
uniref:Uncharacterized protein n=1 Tax=Magallana gigas TaxID=29159 RepID=K1PZ64_MAGGI